MHATIKQRTWFKSPLVEFGEFECRPEDEGYVRHSVARSHLVAFPRTHSLIRQAGDEAIVSTPNVAVLYNRGCEYTCRILDSGCERTTYARIDDATILEAVTDYDPSVGERGARPLSISRAPVEADDFLKHVTLLASAKAGCHDTLVFEEGVLHLLRRVLGSGYALVGRRAPRGTRRDWRHARECATWVEELLARTYRESLSVQEIARRIGFSPFHLCRVFKSVTGVTMHEYRDRLRLRAAIEELRDSSAPIVRVAVELGYSSQSHFSDAFRAHFGVTPGSVRKLIGRRGTSEEVSDAS